MQHREALLLGDAQRPEPAHVTLAPVRDVQVGHGRLDAPERIGQRPHERRDQAVAHGARKPLVMRGQGLGNMLRIAAENLVAAFTGQHHLHAARGFAGKQVDRDVGRLGDRGIAKRHQRREPVDEIAIGDRDLAVCRAEVPRHPRGVAQLAVACLAEADREGIDARAVTTHERHDHRGVQAARQERAERHVAHHLQPDRFVQARRERLDDPRRRLPGVERAAIRRRPVARLDKRAAFPDGRGARLQLADAAEQRSRARHIAMGQVLADGVQVHRGPDAGNAQQRLDLGGEVQAVRVLAQVERLLAEAVPRQQ